MLAISKFNIATILLDTLYVFRTPETKIFLMPCILHLTAFFKIFCNKTSVPDVLFNKSFIPTWIIALSNWPSPSVGLIKKKRSFEVAQGRYLNLAVPSLNWLSKFDLIFRVKLVIISLKQLYYCYCELCCY